MPKDQPPPRVKPQDDSGYFEEMTKAVFRSGFSWEVIENKWPNFRKSFSEFSIDKVAAFDERDVDRLLNDTSIVRNGRKIESTIHNARAIKSIQAEFGSFENYLRTLDDHGYPTVAKDLKERFKHLGRTGTFVFLWSVAEEVPDWEER
jgi:DNA-3-methyladenine glycosylase I